ncbi:ERF family protein, partial [Lentilactobacillus buchneri]|uniref:ERF family protein n=1 Tax=Lentilactobacillus buchneri TaxID=1581 RepID=UPI0021A65BC5
QFDPLNVPVGKNDAQAFGSAETYARRYTLSAVFGVTSDVDDDGNQATKSAPKEQPHKRKYGRQAPAKTPSKPMATAEDKDTIKGKVASLAKEMAMEPKPLLEATMKHAKVSSWGQMSKEDLNALDHELSTELMEFRSKKSKDDEKSSDELFDSLNV